ncbi:hypothetical protein SKAU_G00077730 [Synaphobranchus kaupii]|uniref:Uncharacterized protein n=1 Tax=Synaphobranchus kaupii TaxID=118154 RepID=A0A9Q1JBX8_SYNKA|nr:hypothetical protein SKAU_G00077730 [Synaphobranchus kaupii]
MQQIHQHAALFTDGCGRLFLVEGRGQLVQGGILVGLYEDDSITVVTGPISGGPFSSSWRRKTWGNQGLSQSHAAIVEPLDGALLKDTNTHRSAGTPTPFHCRAFSCSGVAHSVRPSFFFSDSGILGGGGRGRWKYTYTES